MSTVHVYQGDSGWFFEVWVAARLIVLGWCSTRERAEAAAAQV